MMIALFSLTLFAAALWAIVAVVATTLLPAMPRIITLLRSGAIDDQRAAIVPYASASSRTVRSARVMAPAQRRVAPLRAAA